MSRDDAHPTRRNVLRKLGATAAVGAGLVGASGTASAIEVKHRLTRAYSDEEQLRAAFERHGDGLRDALVAEGVVDESFDFADVTFDIDSDETGLEPAADDGVAGVTAFREDGVFTAFGSVSTSSDTHDIALFVQPERGEAYALAEPKSGDRRIGVTESGASTSSCRHTECESCCDENYRTEKTYDCCIEECCCVVVDSSCGCFDCDCGDISTC